MPWDACSPCMSPLANEQDRAPEAKLAEAKQDVTDVSVEVASVVQGDIGERARQDAADYGMLLEVVKRPQAKKGFLRLDRTLSPPRTRL